jgi:hypothetical protein
MTVGAAPARAVSMPPGHYGIGGALRSEWTKLRSVRSTVWSLAATIVAVIGIGIIASAATAAQWRTGKIDDRLLFDPTSRSLSGFFIGQLALGVLGALTISAEYGTGAIRSSFAAIPRRPLVLAAKAIMFGAVALAVAEAVSFSAFFIGQALMSGSAPTATLSQPGVLRAVAGGGLFLTVLGLFALGLGSIVRHTAGAITTFVALLLILPLVVAAFPASIGHPIGRYLPLIIGNNMTAASPRGAHPDFLPGFAPWTGFGLMCVYAAVALVVGAVVMVRRDP